MTYLPLPKSVTISESTIHGLGLVAKENIPSGTDLGISHVFVDDKIIRTPLGGFYNHSLSPNTKRVSNDSQSNLITIKDIKAGEEILVTYTLYDPTK